MDGDLDLIALSKVLLLLANQCPMYIGGKRTSISLLLPPDIVMTAVEIAVYSLRHNQLLWQGVYFAPVHDGQVDWPLIIRSAHEDMGAAGSNL